MFRAQRLLTLAAALAATALIAGCTPPLAKPDPKPQVLEVAVTKYVPLDPALLTRAPVAMPSDNTCVEAVRVARERRAAVEQCNRQLDAIEAGQPKED